jgi:hypothetical protein
MCQKRMHTGDWWGKSEGKKRLIRTRRRWEDNIKLVLKEVGGKA